MIQVTIYSPEDVSDDLLKYSVIAARKGDRWIFCRHKARTTWEIPGGHREKDETAEQCARRELYEETGAVSYELTRIGVYSASSDRGIGYGMLYYADIHALEEIPKEFEIGEIRLFDDCPTELTYPEIQSALFLHVCSWLEKRTNPKTAEAGK